MKISSKSREEKEIEVGVLNLREESQMIAFLLV